MPESTASLPTHCGVLVIGAGPAGSACARVLAQAGVDVLLVDQQPPGRDKTCGDGLIPDAHKALARLGLLEPVMRLAEPVSHVGCIGPRGGRIDVPGTLAVLPRKQLDALLLQAARDAGARFEQARFEAPLEDAGRVVGARLKQGDAVVDVRTPWVVLATGAVPKALTAAGMCERHTPSGVALRGYVKAPAMVGRITALEVVWDKALRPGYGWIFPAPDGHFNIGVGVTNSHRDDDGKGRKRDVNLRAIFDAFVEKYAPAAELMRVGEKVGEGEQWLKGAPLRFTLAGARWTRPGLLVTGEAAGSTYSFDGFATDRLAQSLNVVSNGSGGFNCVNTANGCVAAPALTADVIGGKLPSAWLGFVYGNFVGTTKYKETVVTASTTGSLFKLPYGDLKAAFGAEFRKASIDDTPSEAMQNANIYNFTSGSPTRGSDNATDVFAEFEVPVLKGLTMAKELTLNASIRRADYKSYGSDSTHKIGALWAPAGWISLRGTSGTSYRAPALFEQFVGATTGFLTASGDPCNDYTTKGAVRAANCASENLPANFQQTNSITSITSGGATSGLAAETSRNSSWGIILQPGLPTGWGDLSLAVDRFDIKVDNGVSRVGTGSILSKCYDDPQFRSGGSFCRLVTRNPGNNALSVNNSYVNLATDVVRGYDFSVRYTNEVGPGKLRVNMTATEFKEQSNKLFAEDALDDTNGTLGSPAWSGAMDVNYTVKGWNVFYGLEWVGKMSNYGYYGINPATAAYKIDTPNYFLHSVSLSYTDSVSKWKVSAGVRNIADKNPPQISAVTTYGSNRLGNAPLYSGMDLYGRRFFMNVQKTF